MRLTIRSLVSLVACLALFFFLMGEVSAQSDPQVGVWKINAAKSKYNPGPPPKTATTRIEAAGAGTTVVVDTVASDGTAVNGSGQQVNNVAVYERQ